MKKKNVINLIKYYAEKNDPAFRDEAYEVAKSFSEMGDLQVSEYIMALMSGIAIFDTQGDATKLEFLELQDITSTSLPLPDAIHADIIGLINAIVQRVGISKILFEGPPGTGKTESVKHLARILKRKLYSVNFSCIIDSRLGQTQKNISALFSEMKACLCPERSMILFDEIDSLVLNRTDSNDLREMGRAVSAFLKELDALDENILIVATTNLYKYIDKALNRRFDAVVDFSRYTIEDLQNIAESICNKFLQKFKYAGRNMRLLRKIVGTMHPLIYPGELKNLIKTSLAFSHPDNPYDYLRKLYERIHHIPLSKNLDDLRNQGFTTREIEILTGISKSQVSRILK